MYFFHFYRSLLGLQLRKSKALTIEYMSVLLKVAEESADKKLAMMTKNSIATR